VSNISKVVHLQWQANRKSYMIYRVVPFSMTLNGIGMV